MFNVGDRASFDACFALGERARAMSDAVLVCCGVTGKGEDALTPRVVTEAEARARCEESGVEYFEADLGASDGRVEAVFTALALRDQFAPPTIHYEQPDPECDLDYVPNAGRAQAMTYALSNSLGFGGHNACIALRRWEG